MCHVPWVKSRIGQILAVTINFIYIYTFNTVIFNFRRDVKVSIAMGENSDRMTQILVVSRITSHNPIPPSAPPPRRLCNILTIPLIGSKSPYSPPPPLYSVAKAKNGDLFLISGQRFSENGKFMIFFPFLITFPFS